MARADRMLAEMGLAPRWVLRGARAEEVPAPVIDTPPPVMVEDAPIAPVANPVTPATPIAASEREAAIAAMDWDALDSAVKGCTACGLCKTRKQTVFGVGDRAAEIVIVGEAPGAEEDARGEPFVGQAGRLLDNMLARIDRGRTERIYIANVLKCRPPGNRNPEPAEVAACSPHLLRQIALARPKLLVAMGRFAAQTLLATDASIASLRGRVHRYQGLPLIVTYHPAYLLRNLPDKSKAWEDLLFVRRTLLNESAPLETRA